MSQVLEVKQATDIIQLIGERITLARSGTNWRGLCPFHSEKSPSFFVSEQFQRYRCFGCGETGDAFTFLEKYEGLTFPEALQILADRAGITLAKEAFGMSAVDEQRVRVLEILDLAREYYHYLLTKHKAGEVARAYLKERGVTQDSVKLFQLGYALDDWDGLMKFLHGKKKYALADLLAAGLVIQSQRQPGRSYDRFRGRLMFPLTDARGRVVGFSGRILQGDQKDAKYINTPETMLYHKAQLLFGYSQLYQHIRQAKEVIVVEGEFDVISSAQAHVNHVVAVKGSALTDAHAKLLQRTVERVILSFDMDAAGVEATKRAIQVVQPYGLELRVLQLPEGEGVAKGAKDPDELARTNPAQWREIAKSSISVYEFCLRAAVRRANPQTPEGRRQIMDEVGPVLAQITHAVELDFYLHKLAEVLHVPLSTVQTDIERIRRFGSGRGVSSIRPTSQSSSTSNPPSSTQKASDRSKPPAKPTRKGKLAEYALFLLLQTPDADLLARAEQLKHVRYPQPAYATLIERILATPAPFHLKRFNQDLPEDLQQTVFTIVSHPEYVALLPELALDKEWQRTTRELITVDIGEELAEIAREIELLEQKSTRSAEDDTHLTTLLARMVKLRAKQQER